MTSSAPVRAPLMARIRNFPLGVRLAVVSATVTSLVVAAAFVSLRERVDSDVRTVFVHQLLERQRDFSQLQRERLQLLLATSSLASTSPTLRAALDTRTFESDTSHLAQQSLLGTIQREVDRLYRDVGRDLLIVTDEKGQVLAAQGRTGTPRVGDALISLPSVRSALDPDSTSSTSAYGVLIVNGTPMQVGCVPVLVNGFPIGTLIVGERLDRFMPKDTITGSTEVVVEGDRVIASTLDALKPNATWTRPTADTSGTTTISIAGEELLGASVPLGMTASGQVAQLYLLHSLSASLHPLEAELGSRFLLFGVIAVVLIAICSAVATGSALMPLSRFVAYLQAGTRGASLEAYQDARNDGAPTEIRTLTGAFNGLVLSVRVQQQQLENRSVELAAANEVLRAEVRERERAEAALVQSESQLRHSQKLEALGTLAGGVAHDFNNVLAVIMGYAQLLALEFPKESRARNDIDCISEASKRARELVRQLLAFSRKQVLKPVMLDPNHVITGLKPLFNPLLGETVKLEIQLEADVHRIKADPTQLEQVILNLVVNARDAMPTGGIVRVETANVLLDEDFANGEDAIASGPAVTLTVTDTGTGMDEATRNRIFEPFFTTKAPGEGTGLGLATVYGIVRQSGGTIVVESTPAVGTTFRIYFPMATEDSVADEGRTPSVVDETVGTETVLVVEDEVDLRLLVRRVLEHRGYNVLEAADGRAAIEVAARHYGPIDLLLTDVILPHLSGIELAAQMRLDHPQIRVLFVSGYNAEVVARQGRLSDDTEFLAKPVLPDALARAVRRMLDGQPVEESYA